MVRKITPSGVVVSSAAPTTRLIPVGSFPGQMRGQMPVTVTSAGGQTIQQVVFQQSPGPPGQRQVGPPRFITQQQQIPVTIEKPNTPLPTTLSLPQEPLSPAQMAMSGPPSVGGVDDAHDFVSTQGSVQVRRIVSPVVSTHDVFQKPLPVSSTGGMKTFFVPKTMVSQQQPQQIVVQQQQPQVVNSGTPLPKQFQLPSEPVPITSPDIQHELSQSPKPDEGGGSRPGSRPGSGRSTPIGNGGQQQQQILVKVRICLLCFFGDELLESKLTKA